MYKEVNKQVRNNIKHTQNTLNIEKKKFKNYRSLVNLQEENLKHEMFEYEKTKDSLQLTKTRRTEVEKEIYRLENILKGIQGKRERFEKKYEDLETLKAEKDQEIQVIHRNIKKKEDEIKDTQELVREIEENLDKIVETTLKM